METSTNMKKETFHKNKRPWFANVKIFLMLLSLMFFAKAFSGSYMKSTITSIERRFDLPSSVAGMVDSGFEIGNLLVMAFVSYFGAKFHRPRVIAIGATIMSIGTLLIAVPHFLMDRYTYESISAGVVNVSNSVCETENPPHTSTEHILDTESCQHKIRSKMWILVLVGNMLRGIGETPIGPLGISYVDDFARPENSGLYLGCLFSVALIGPIFGFLMGSFTTKVFVDIGFVPMEEVTITPKDNRWVGAWWLGFLVTGIVSLLVTLPFWFFPRSVDSEMEEPSEKEIHGGGQQEVIANGEKAEPESQKVFALAKGFLPSLRELFINSVYFTMLVGTVFQLNGLIGFITFQAKFIEQQFGESASRANFLIGAVNLPAVALGIFCGGVVVKRCKLSMSACAKMAFITGLIAWLLGLGHFLIRCENIRVPGLTTTYNGLDTSSSSSLLSSCNARCHCKSHVWDPVCGRDGITYLSPCMGGCQTMVGSGKTAVFEDCQCVAEGMVGNATATLGPCPRERCFNSFILLICVEVLAAFISCLGYTPTYLIFIRSIPKQLKAFALGMQTLAVRTLAGIPAPIYFGAALDQTCIKWMVNACSMRGACRLYNVDKFRVTFFSMMSSLRFVGLIFILATIKLILRRESKENEQAAKENGQEDPMQPLGPSNGKAGNETLRDLLTTQVLGEVNGPSDALKASDVCVDGALTEVDEESIV